MAVNFSIKRLVVCLCATLFFATPTRTFADDTIDYWAYHQTIIEVETAVARQDYHKALSTYKQVFDRYEFVFLRDYQIAAQLALHLGRTDEAFGYLRKGIAGGWDKKSIRKHVFLRKMRTLNGWKVVEQQYDSLRGIYQAKIDQPLRKETKIMFRKDQWKALGALFTVGSRGQERYAEKRFAPQSEQQTTRLIQLIRTHGYPGEQLTGNNFRVSTILSHHNSISTRYALTDTLYARIKPLLVRAVGTGHMAPYELALIDNWYVTISSDRKDKSYGYLDALSQTDLIRADQLRSQIGLRSVALRNSLLDVQQQTGMNFHLPARPQCNGKIRVILP